MKTLTTRAHESFQERIIGVKNEKFCQVVWEFLIQQRIVRVGHIRNFPYVLCIIIPAQFTFCVFKTFCALKIKKTQTHKLLHFTSVFLFDKTERPVHYITISITFNDHKYYNLF